MVHVNFEPVLIVSSDVMTNQQVLRHFTEDCEWTAEKLQSGRSPEVLLEYSVDAKQVTLEHDFVIEISHQMQKIRLCVRDFGYWAKHHSQIQTSLVVVLILGQTVEQLCSTL